MDRRKFLGQAAVLSGAFGASTLVASCTTEREPGPSQSDNKKVPLPTYRESNVITADLKGTGNLMPGFLAYPGENPKSVSGTAVTSGVPISAMASSASPFAPLAKNKVWQEMNSRLGGEIKYIAAQGNLVTKLQTAFAGGDIPDITQLANVPRLPDILQTHFADLTEYLAGDAINDYPNLAAIPSSSWRGCVYNGGIYTLPVTRGALGSLLLTRRDILDKHGLPQEIKSGDEFLEVCRALTKPSENKWAIGQKPTEILLLVLQMLGGPYLWREENGKFTHQSETDEFVEALNIVTKMAQEDKVFHPDAFAAGDPQAKFIAGNTALQYGSYAQWAFQVRQGAGQPGFSVGCYTAPKWSGGGLSRQFISTGPFQISGIRKATPDRVREILRVANFWAAPFGSDEYTLRIYGLRDRDHTLDGTDPILTDVGKTEVPSPASAIVSAPPILYVPSEPDAVKAQHEIQSKIVADGVATPTIGLYSETVLAKGLTIDKKLVDWQTDIISGRKPVSTWPEAVKEWKQNGGDAIAAEYAAAFAAN